MSFRDPRPPRRPGTALSAAAARELLRKLRDLNLTAQAVALDRQRCVSIEGCRSLDAPADGVLRYRLRLPDGVERLLGLRFEADRLSLELCDMQGQPVARAHSVRIECDELGRATAREWGARIDPELSGERELSRFLRRIVRGAFAT